MRAWSILVGKDEEAASIAFATRHSERRREIDREILICWSVLLFGQFEAPAHDMVLLTVRMALPTSLN